MAPTQNVFKETFADKTNDSRYDGTFTYTFRANWDFGGNNTEKGIGANGMDIKVGDAVLTFVDNDNNISYNENGADVGAGTTAGRADYVVGPSGISRLRSYSSGRLAPIVQITTEQQVSQMQVVHVHSQSANSQNCTLPQLRQQ